MPISAKDALKHFHQITCFDVARRNKLSEMMKSSQDELRKCRTETKTIGTLFSKYLSEGVDVRNDIKTTQVNLAKDREVLKEKQAPFRAVVSPLQRAVSYLNKKSPSVLAEAGMPVIPIYEVPEDIKVEMDKAKASKKQ